MKTTSYLAYAVASLLASQVNGHCESSVSTDYFTMMTDEGLTDIFQQVGAGGVKGKVYEHIRKNTNHNSPITGIYSFSSRSHPQSFSHPVLLIKNFHRQ
jgi:hypothetical protein